MGHGKAAGGTQWIAGHERIVTNAMQVASAVHHIKFRVNFTAYCDADGPTVF
jgi:hypothetical protein